MNKLFRYALLVLLLGAGTVFAQSPSQVKKIELKQVGSQTISEPLIRANIRVKEGDQFSRLAVDDDVRNLYGTGYFYNIRILEDPTPEGVVLTYILVAKPRVTDIKYVGNTKWDAKSLQKVVKSKVGEPLDERKLFADAQEIKKKYINSGYNRTEVEYKIVNLDENAGRGTVQFEIKETPKIRVVNVMFDGAQSFSQKKLRKEMKTRRWWIFSWITQGGKLKDDVLEDDQDKLADFYRNQGYIDFELKEVKREFLSPTRVIVHFIINEGRRYKVGAIGFKGATLYSTNDLAKVLKMKVGETFTPKALNEDREALEDYYGAKGYVDAGVFARKNPNIETGTMDLIYEIREGEQFKIGRIDIKGNVKTKDKVIRRELAVSPGEMFDMVRVKRSKTRLQQMGFFERVDTRAEEADARDEKNLVVGVEEKNTGNFTIGAGFSSVDSLVGFVEIYQGNFDLFKPPTFTGAGQKFRLRASVGTVRQDYQISFIEPWFLDQKLALGVDLYYRELGFYSTLFDERRGGGKVSLTRALGSDFLIGSVSYTVEDVGIVRVNQNAPTTILDAEGDHILHRLGASIAYDTRNNALLPDRGQRTELVGEAVVGDANLYKLEAKTAWFFPGFAEGHVLEVGVKAGVVEALSSFGQDTGPYRYFFVTNAITGISKRYRVKNQPHNDVPFFERYFLGGAYSLRGFRYRDVGPQERGAYGVNSEPVGGNTYYLAYGEYSVPIIAPNNVSNPNEVSLRLAAFYDMGNVYYKSYQFDPADFSSDVGLGIRLNIPRLGPLRFDYAIPLRDSTGNAGGGRFNFTVGYQREF
jgi:outer membrane protein insertion porin family